jgi:hypothetical protein
MVYKAIIPVGKYKIGDVVPDEEAANLLKIYKYPHVEKVSDSPTPKTESKKKDFKVEETPNMDSWMDDYLARNEWVVKKALGKDKHNKSILKKLYNLEAKDKDRKKILTELKKQMEA